MLPKGNLVNSTQLLLVMHSPGVSRMARWTDDEDPNSTTCASRTASVDNNSLWRTASMTLQHTLTFRLGNGFLVAEEEAALSVATCGTPDHNIWIAIGSPQDRVTVYSLRGDGSMKQVASLSAPNATQSPGLCTIAAVGRRHSDDTIAAARSRTRITGESFARLKDKGWRVKPRFSYDGAVHPFCLPGSSNPSPQARHGCFSYSSLLLLLLLFSRLLSSPLVTLVSSPLVSSRLLSSRLVSSRLVSSPLLSSPLLSSPLVSSRLLSSPLVSSRLLSSPLVSSRLLSSPLVSSRLLSSPLLSSPLLSSPLLSSPLLSSPLLFYQPLAMPSINVPCSAKQALLQQLIVSLQPLIHCRRDSAAGQTGARPTRPDTITSGTSQPSQQLPFQVEIQGPLMAVGGPWRLSSARQETANDGEVLLYEWDPELCKYTNQTTLVADEPGGHGGGFGHSLSLGCTGSGPSRRWRLAVGAPNFDGGAGRVYVYERSYP